MSLAAVDTTTGEVMVATAGPLAALEQARHMLERAETIDEVKAIRDKAEVLRVLSKKVKLGLEMQNRCAEIRLRAERKAGDLLAETVVHGTNQWTSHDDRSTLKDFGLSWSQSSRWQRIASVPDEAFEEYVGRAEELTSAGVLKLAKQLTAAVKPAAPSAPVAPAGEVTPDIFTTIVIDPPWQYDNKSTRGAAEDHYPTMSYDELVGLELPATEAAHLYLWVTNNFLREGLELCEAWDFSYKTLLTWVKPQMGMGNYFRSVTEHVIFGVRGSLPTLRRDRTNVINADRTRHSAKPDAFYDLVEEMSPGPWLEMFARRRRLGAWHVWGNEA